MPMLTAHTDAFSHALAAGIRYVTIKLQRNIDYDRVAPLANLAEPLGWRVEAVWFSELGITNVLFRHQVVGGVGAIDLKGAGAPSGGPGRGLPCCHHNALWRPARRAHMKTTGIKLIEEERERQVSEEGYSRDHDDEHTEGNLALAAACYATPIPLYKTTPRGDYLNPWPWSQRDDKRIGPDDGEAPHPSEHTTEERIDLLTKAGALIAAEIDRLLRQREGLV